MANTPVGAFVGPGGQSYIQRPGQTQPPPSWVGGGASRDPGIYYYPPGGTQSGPKIVNRLPGASGPRPIGMAVPGKSPAAGQPATPARGTTAGGTAGGTGANVQTSITPTPIYQPWQTQQAVNVAHAQQMQNASLPWLMQQYASPGMGVNSPATMARAIPHAAQAHATGRLAQQQIPLQDAIANAQHMLAGQTARESEGLNLSQLLAQLAQTNRSFDMNQGQNLAGLLAGLAGL